jgi:hypothetical protein
MPESALRGEQHPTRLPHTFVIRKKKTLSLLIGPLKFRQID